MSEIHSARTLDLLRRTPTPTLSLSLFKRGHAKVEIAGAKPLDSARATFVGPAFTIRYIPVRPDMGGVGSLDKVALYHRAVDSVPSGAVVVLGTGGVTTVGSVGDLMVARLIQLGAAGLVTDGAARDVVELRKLAFPVFAVGSAAQPLYAELMAVGMQEPIGCGGVAVFPGDLVVADGNGAIVVPHQLAEEVAEEAFEIELLERFMRRRLDDGKPLLGSYPPDEEALKAFAAFKKESGTSTN